LDTTLNCHFVAEDDVVFNEAVRADVAAVADACIRKDNTILPDPSPRADMLSMHFRRGVDEDVFTHIVLLLAEWRDPSVEMGV
jgi:hypothetical protein